MRRAVIALLVLATATLRPTLASAHDDPVLTVRVLCQGITDGDIATAMGEVDDNATIDVDRPVSGREAIIAWIQQQLTLNLRIEVVSVTPTQTADGYDVTWTTHMYREDWRKAGVPMRPTTEHATIHNGRVTHWTSSLASQATSAAGPAAAPQPAALPASAGSTVDPANGPSIAGVPLAQIPIGLVVVVLLFGGSGAWLVIAATRRPRKASDPRVVHPIESLAPRAAERKG